MPLRPMVGTLWVVIAGCNVSRRVPQALWNLGREKPLLIEEGEVHRTYPI